MGDTRHQILNAAERMFARHGIGATSLRRVMAEAGVNPAAVHYHFGGRDGLLEAMLLRRIQPVNAERLRRLDELEAAAGAEPPALAAVVEAFCAPPLRLACAADEDGAQLMRLLGRFYHHSGEAARAVLEREFRPVVERFAAALAPRLPRLDARALAWRLHFAVGAMAHTMSCAEPAAWLGGPAPESERDVEAVVAELVRFATAGLLAPAQAAEARR